MKKLLAFSLLFITANSFASQYLCSYTARISNTDKYNGSGDSLVTGYNKSSVAAILRQDRANFYVYQIRDKEDSADCVMNKKANRATFERLISNQYTSISNNLIREIIDRSPVIKVVIYNDHIEFRQTSNNSLWK